MTRDSRSTGGGGAGGRHGSPRTHWILALVTLGFLLQRQGIEDAHQRKLFAAGVDTLDKFSAFATGEPDLLASSGWNLQRAWQPEARWHPL